MARDEAYTKAERKIEEARRSGAPQLRLGGMGLTELPESLGQLTQLQSLILHKQPTDDTAEVAGQAHTVAIAAPL